MKNALTNHLRRSVPAVAAAVVLAAVAMTGCSTDTGDDVARAASSVAIGASSESVVVAPGETDVGPDRDRDVDIRPETGDTGEKVRALHRYGEYARPEGATNWTTMYEFLEFVLHDADGFWTGELVAVGLSEPMVQYVVPAPGESYRTACNASDDDSMYYCPADDTIVFSQDIATRLWNGTYVGPSTSSSPRCSGTFDQRASGSRSSPSDDR